MSPTPNRRSIKLVDRKFQIDLALRLLVSAILFFFLGLVIVFAPSFYLMATTSDPESLETVASEFLVLHKRIWPAVIICFLGMFAYCLFLSHRIAGPIYRINAVLRNLIAGEQTEKVTFRKNDCFLPTAELLEQLAGKMRDTGSKSGKNPGG
ncbi:MAG: exported protein of unknown function, MCP-like, partial [Deltaproteobacteria bacterium]|nr:exported protein of unknown function, MCP-like [Deltaproteobacteria bacterium]